MKTPAIRRSQKHGKCLIVALILMGVLSFTILACIGGVYFYLKSDSFKELVRSSFSESAGADLQFDDMAVSLFEPGFTRLRIPNTAPWADENFLNVEETKVSVDFWGSTLDSVVIDSMTFEKPSILLRQTPEGNFHMPFVPKNGAADESTAEAAGEALPPAGDVGDKFQVEVKNFELKKADIRATDPDKNNLFHFKGLDLSTKLSGGKLADTRLSVEELIAGPGLKMTGLVTLPYYDSANSTLALPEITGEAYSGALAASGNLYFKPDGISYSAEYRLKGISASSLLEDLGNDPKTLQGKLDLALTGIQGDFDAPRELTAKGSLMIDKPVMEQFKAVKGLGMLYVIPAVENGQFDKLDTRFAIAEQTIYIEKMSLTSPQLSIDLKGSIRFNTSLSLHGTIDLNPDHLSTVTASFNQFGIIDLTDIHKEIRQLPIEIRGTTSAPEIFIQGIKVNDDMNSLAFWSNLVHKIFPDFKTKALDQGAGLLNSLLGGEKKETVETEEQPPQNDTNGEKKSVIDDVKNLIPDLF